MRYVSIKSVELLLVMMFFLMGIVECHSKGGEEEEVNYTALRKDMVEHQIKARGIKDENVLKAMLKVPREEFVPESLKPRAYDDCPLPIGEGQTISQPYIVALMTELLKVSKGDKVLEIGTGSGYQAVILAEMGCDVYTIEIIESLSLNAQEVIKKLGYTNIHFKIGDGFVGWEDFAPYDAVIVTCAPDEIPKPLIDQLKEGGRLVIPVGEHLPQDLVLAIKEKGKIKEYPITSVAFVPMTGIAQEK
ncbi:MAG: protein-L-isoaspartate(D-aspartate) O-methyltransferase [bacterium]